MTTPPVELPAVDPAVVAGWLGLPGDPAADDNLTLACRLTTNLVNGLPWVARYTAATDPPAWPGGVDEASVMLAARLYRRRNTPSGVESFGESPATYVLRHDPDVARALRIGPNAMPRVG